MLVLSRRVGEEILIDGCVRVTITAIRGNNVRIGITAPPTVSVDRKEVHDRRVEFNLSQLEANDALSAGLQPTKKFSTEVLPCSAR